MLGGIEGSGTLDTRHLPSLSGTNADFRVDILRILLSEEREREDKAW
jgi:hypothetical protein